VLFLDELPEFPVFGRNRTCANLDRLRELRHSKDECWLAA